MSPVFDNRNRLMLTTAALIALAASGTATAGDQQNSGGLATATPIKHLIILIGENHSFDNVYGMFRPRGKSVADASGMTVPNTQRQQSQSVSNLLSKGIVNSSGMTVLNTQAQQFFIQQPYPSTYFIDSHTTAGKNPYPILPQPNTAYLPTAAGGLSQGQGPFDSTDVLDSLLPTLEPSLEPKDLGLLRTGASGLPMFSEDTRVASASNLPNGSFQITNQVNPLPYDSYVGDMVHRLFHMWQQSDCSRSNATPDNPSGCLSDLYPFVGVARNDGSGSNSMGFYNVSNGDAPVLKQLADKYTLNDNYHQPVMGGTAVQHIMLGTADAIPWDTFAGQSAPPLASIANPNPKIPGSGPSATVAFTVDGNWTNCSDITQPGIAPIVNYLKTLPWNPAPNCANGAYYMINNMSPGFKPNGVIDSASILAGAKVPPSSLRTIGDALNEKGISWAYYGGGYDAAVRVANGSTDPVDQLIGGNYCDICNPFSYATSIMGNPNQRSAHIKDAIDFFNALENGTLPAVAYVKPDSLVDGHPASSKLDLFEAMLENIFNQLNKQNRLSDTALFVTFDEGGGYYDSGFIQPIDFFGDGPRIPLIVVSKYSTGGNIVHSYNDHASIVKFIERNWGLQPLTSRSRDNLRNPNMDPNHPYVPVNMPAVGDLFDMFNFN
jgi:acid phosphatase